jgi:hypothetical protein
MGVIWQGHEAECYKLSSSSNTEDTGAREAGYERAGMKIPAGTPIRSAPDWSSVDELWHRFRYNCTGGYAVGFVLWGVENAAGQILAQIVCVTTSTWQFQVWDGAAFVNVGSPQNYVSGGTVGRFDIHMKGGNPGQVEVYGGAPGSTALQLSATGNYNSVVNMVRIYHNAPSIAGGFNSYVAGEVVQTTPTLNTVSEMGFPASNGADTGGTGTYADVDEQNFSDSDFVAFSAAGQHQSFKAAARTLTDKIVTGVTASCRAWYEAGGATQIKPYLTIGGTRYYGPTLALTLVPAGYQYTWTTNPATGIAFTQAQANDATMEWGWEAV